MQKNRRLLCALLAWLLLLLWGIAAFCLSRQDGDSTKALSVGLTMQVLKVIRRLGWSANLEMINQCLRKMAHVAVYLSFGGLMLNALRCTWEIKPLQAMVASSLICAAVSFADEFQKAFIPGRHCDPEEIVLNCIAALLGSAITAAWMQGRIRRMANRRNQ